MAGYKSDNEVGTTLESKDLPFSRGSPLNSTSCNLVLWTSIFESVKMNPNLEIVYNNWMFTSQLQLLQSFPENPLLQKQIPVLVSHFPWLLQILFKYCGHFLSEKDTWNALHLTSFN